MNIKGILGNILEKQYPATVTWAKFHRNICKYSQKYSKLKEKDSNQIISTPICPCCKNQVIIESISLSYGTSLPNNIVQDQEKFILSSDVCLFFMFIKMCIYFLLLRLLVCDLYNIITSMNSHYCQENPNKCTNYLQSILAGYNKHSKQDQQYLNVLDILNFVMTIITILYFNYFRRLFNRVNNFLNHVDITEDDFAIKFKGIPSIIRSNQQKGHRGTYQVKDLNKSIQEHLKQVFQTVFYDSILPLHQHQSKQNTFNQYLQQPLIANVSLCYDLSQFQNLNKIQQNIFHQLFTDQSVKQQFQKVYVEQIQNQKKRIQNKIKNNKYMSNQQQQETIDYLIFQFQAKKIKEIFFNNFRYRISKDKIDEDQEKNISDFNIRKYLIFLSKIDDLTTQARKKYVNKDKQQANHSFFIQKAFITFQNQKVRNMILDQYQKNPKLFQINNKYLQIAQPTQPQDIIWRNLKVTSQKRQQSLILSFIILFMCIGFSFFMTFLAEQLQVRLTKPNNKSEQSYENHFQEEKNLEDQEQTILTSSRNLKKGSMKISISFDDKLQSDAFNTGMILITIGINNLLEVIIKKVTELQKYSSKTKRIQTMLKRFVIYKFLNTCIIYFIIYMFNSQVEILSTNGLMNKIIKLVSISALVDVIVNIFLPTPTLKLLYFTFIYRNCSYVNKTQHQLNQQLSYPQFDFVERCSYYVVQLYIVSFYAYLCPIAVPLVLVIFVIQYWIDKVNLFKRCIVNDSIGFKLTQSTLQLCQSSVLVFSLGNIFFYQITNIYEDFRYTVLNIIAFLISLTYIVSVYAAPKFMNQIFWKSQKLYINQSYSELRKKDTIQSTYWSQNPATSRSSKSKDIQLNQIKIQENLLKAGYQLSYQSFSVLQAVSKIFLPDQLTKFWKWNEKYEVVIERYNKQDERLYGLCFGTQLKRQNPIK